MLVETAFFVMQPVGIYLKFNAPPEYFEAGQP
jgi:hypothetical protein